MEEKKSRKADLERGRSIRLWLSFFIAIALMIAVLFIPMIDVEDEFDEETFNEVVEELHLKRMQEEEPRFVMATPQQEQADRIRVVDEAEEEKKAADDDKASKAEKEVMETEEEKEEDEKIEEDDDNPLKFRVLEDLPQYPGGPIELVRWLTKNLRYPTSAKVKKVEGKVVAQFIVNADGSLSDFKIVKSLNDACDREALRVLRLMPRWKAGVQNDKPCRTVVAIPIVFKLS